MSATASKLLERVAIIDWLLGLFITFMIVLMFVLPGQETIPFHLLFLSLGLVYGLRVWGLAVISTVVIVTTVVTGAAMVLHWRQDFIEAPELVEVPLMPALILAMVWHARRRAEAQLQMAAMADERAANLVRQREFFRDACHAIRTPVTIARGHVDLADDTASDPEVGDDLAVVRTQLDRMSRLSSRLMAIAELDQGDSLVLEPIDLADVVAELGHHWANSATRHWVLDVHETGQVLAARDWIEQSLDALVENALRFTATTDTIRISCRLLDRSVRLEVADSGPGIDPSDRELVFDRFWHRPTADGHSGSGLGLATVSSVIAGHGGTVRAFEAPEGGALIRLEFPPGVMPDVPVSRPRPTQRDRMKTDHVELPAV